VDDGAEPLAAADTALAWWAAAAARDAERLLSGPPRAAFRAALLPDAAAELKALLRGVAAGDRADRAAARALPLPALPAAAVRAVASGPLDRAPHALAAAGSPLAAALRTALAARGAEAGLLHVEAVLDREVFRLALASAGRRGADAAVARRAIARAADHANAALLLALGGASLAPEWLAPGGAVAVEAWLRVGRLAPGDRAEAVARRLGGRRGPPAPEELAEAARAEAALAGLAERALAREARAQPLTIAVPLAWVAAARGEARRVRLALRGAAFGLAPADLLDLLEG
jgi:V/A-type H+-transporting ATPase subunit C